MTEEQTENLDSQNEAEEVETSEEETTTDDSQEENKDELSDREKQFLARAKKAESKLKELKDKPSEEPKKSKSGDFDYGELAYLEMKGVESDEQISFVKKIMDKTGDSLKETLADEYVKNRLKSIKEETTVKNATPTNTKRAQTSGRNSVDYWLKKGELPPTSEVELRRKVVNAKIQKEKQKSKFSDNSVVNQLG